jgi:hypothetical protein
MTDAGGAGQWLDLQPLLQILEFAFGPTALDLIAFEGGESGRIVPAVLKPLERIHQLLSDRTASENPDNAAHADQYLQINERALCCLNESGGSAGTQ